MATSFRGYRRRIRIVPQPNRIDVDMEDDCHHFGVSIEHDGAVISRVETRELHFPWTSCQAAGAFLRERMTGLKLAEAAAAESQRSHCTHMYDLFVLGVRHAFEDRPVQYEIRVSDGDRLAQLERNGTVLLSWRIDDDSDANGIRGGSFRDLEVWSRTLPEDMQEPARMLRRGVMVSGARGLPWPLEGSAAELFPQKSGICFSFQPNRAANTMAAPGGALRDYSGNPEEMLAGEWDDQRSERAARS